MHLSSPRRGSELLRLVGASVTALAATGLAVLAGGTASATLPVERGTQHRPAVHKVRVAPSFFGVHDAQLNALSRPGTGSIRLWDTGTSWGQLEPSDSLPPEEWQWSRLDQIVTAAHRNGTQVTLVLGTSPSYAASSATAAPDLQKYEYYVRTVMARYSPANWGYRGIESYQVWNEANISTFWTGGYPALAEMTKAVHDIRNQLDPGAKVVAPAMVTRLGYEQKGIKQFFATKVPSTGRPVWSYVDALSLNLYPRDTVPVSAARPQGRTRPATPEDSMTLLSQVRGLLAADRVPATIPIWNTEVNYGLVTGARVPTAARPIPSSLQVAYVLRTFLLNAAQGVQRVDWYAYDMGTLSSGTGTLGNTLLTRPAPAVRSKGILTPAGRAFTRIQGWLKGGTLIGTTTRRPCLEDRHGTYTCTIRYARGTGRVYWNPYRQAKITLVKSARTKIDQYGVTGHARGGSRLRVGPQPVLVRSKK
jgi:hypothetical protein